MHYRFLCSLLLVLCTTTYTSDNQAVLFQETWRAVSAGQAPSEIPLAVFGIPKNADGATLSPRPYSDYAQLLLQQSCNDELTPQEQYDYARAAKKQANIARAIITKQLNQDTETIAAVEQVLRKTGSKKAYRAHTLNAWKSLAADTSVNVDQLLKASFSIMLHNDEKTQQLFAQLSTIPNPSIELSWLLGKCSQKGLSCPQSNITACRHYACILSACELHPLKKSCLKQMQTMLKDSCAVTKTIISCVCALETALEKKDYDQLCLSLKDMLTYIEKDTTVSPEMFYIARQYAQRLAQFTEQIDQGNNHKNIIYYSLGRFAYIDARALCTSLTDDKSLGIDLMKEAISLLEKSRSPEFAGFDRLLAQAYYDLALLYEKPDQANEQFETFTKAIAFHDPATEYLIGRFMLENGSDRITNNVFNLCIGLVFRAAENGHPPAQAYAAFLAYHGNKVRFGNFNIGKNNQLAFKYASQIYKTDHKAALIYAQLLFANSTQPSKKEVTEAKKCTNLVYKNSNDALAIEICGEFCKEKLFDYKLAFKCFSKSALLDGNEMALLELAQCYAQGITPASNYKADPKSIDLENAVDCLCFAITKANKMLVKSEIFTKPIDVIKKAIDKARIHGKEKQAYLNRIDALLKEKLSPKTI